MYMCVCTEQMFRARASREDAGMRLREDSYTHTYIFICAVYLREVVLSVCIYVYLYIYTYICIFEPLMRMYMSIHVYIYTHMHLHIHLHIHMCR